MASPSTSTTPPPTKYAVVLFPGFQALDVFGPLDILNTLSRTHPLSLSLLAATMDPVSTNTSDASAFSEAILPTHTFATAPSDIEVLLVPGGSGTRDAANIAPAVQFVADVFPQLQYLVTVCTGSALVAKTGVLNGRRATTNKKAWTWATSQGPAVHWVAKARWVTDGKIWSSSGVAAGIDVTYAFVAAMYGDDMAQELADGVEYVRNTDASNDPFAERWGVVQPQPQPE
ncbi:class I glutamine amidotransferase-like protein [Pseudovirgaria hyperparasitica]|uniref:Class I glutamine amidotransferase-like protein n=1 Tax=Pseudovirgaria hyperparasitica TaxID=470096 RepID=A0A6A6W761_9PEZI|nr:class I glutamine amidotransferase-like protein [Pseudovirgaria hyperparasitica]KAF2758385.1 class I glutamine amidotransferase-like protein [Pseudovirgaria hyperparasitica]